MAFRFGVFRSRATMLMGGAIVKRAEVSGSAAAGCNCDTEALKARIAELEALLKFKDQQLASMAAEKNGGAKDEGEKVQLAVSEKRRGGITKLSSGKASEKKSGSKAGIRKLASGKGKASKKTSGRLMFRRSASANEKAQKKSGISLKRFASSKQQPSVDGNKASLFKSALKVAEEKPKQQATGRLMVSRFASNK